MSQLRRENVDYKLRLSPICVVDPKGQISILTRPTPPNIQTLWVSLSTGSHVWLSHGDLWRKLEPLGFRKTQSKPEHGCEGSEL